MAKIILKDGNCILTEYSARQIKVPGKDSDGHDTTFKFTRLAEINAYAIEGTEPENNKAKYKVVKSLVAIPSDDFYMFDTQNLDGAPAVLITTKNLTAGNIYFADELY